jgi:hypothetical protein
MPRVSLWESLGSAFNWHWNLLALGAGAAFAFLSGQHGLVFPLMAAAEVAYLGLVGTNPRYIRILEARKAAAEAAKDTTGQQMAAMIANLPANDRARFQELRDQCLTLTELARRLRHPASASEPPTTLTSMRMESLDRLLWMFLKLLYSRDALSRFLDNTERGQLQQELSSIDKELTKAKKEPQKAKLVQTYQDSMDTLKERLANVDKAEGNLELIKAELNRIEQKVRAISETALSAGTAEEVGTQVDNIAAGVATTEEALKGFEGLPPIIDDATPSILRRGTSETA